VAIRNDQNNYMQPKLRGSYSRAEQAEMSSAAKENRSHAAKQAVRAAKLAHRAFNQEHRAALDYGLVGRNYALGAHVGSPLALHDEN
jgi:hypothetical protein